jgi:integrase
MASIVRRRGSAIWTCFFRDENGRQHCRSTETTDRKIAQRLAEEFEAAAQKKRTLRQLQRVLDQMHELLSGEQVCRASLRAFVQEWLETKRLETAPRTLEFYKTGAQKFVAFLGPRADGSLSEITKADLVAYRNALAKKLCPKTTNHRIKVVRMLLRAAKRDGHIVDDPSEFLEAVRGKHSNGSRRAFTVEELKAVLSVADLEWQSLIRFGLYTGQRLGDLARLRWSNVDLSQTRFGW